MILDDTTDGKVLLGKRNHVWGIDEQKRAKTREGYDLVSEQIRARHYQGTHIRTVRKDFNRENPLFVDQNSEKEKGSDDTRFTFALSLVDEVYQLFAVLRLFLGTTIVINEV